MHAGGETEARTTLGGRARKAEEDARGDSGEPSVCEGRTGVHALGRRRGLIMNGGGTLLVPSQQPGVVTGIVDIDAMSHGGALEASAVVLLL